jgi:hypothetical protein
MPSFSQLERGADGAGRTGMATSPDHEAALTVQVMSLTQKFFLSRSVHFQHAMHFSFGSLVRFCL